MRSSFYLKTGFFVLKVTKMSFSARGALHFLIKSYKETGMKILRLLSF